MKPFPIDKAISILRQATIEWPQPLIEQMKDEPRGAVNVLLMKFAPK
jgi:hypothetical protein